MSNMTHGMNVEEVRRLASDLQKIGNQLDAMSRQVEGRVAGVGWSGREAERFKREWWPKHRRHMQRVAIDLRGFGDSARNNAEEQERVSGNVRPAGVGPLDRSLFDPVNRFEGNLVGPLGTLFSSLGALKSGHAYRFQSGPLFSKFGTKLGYFSSAVTVVDGVISVSEGRFVDAGLSAGDLGATALKASRNPLGYAAGVTTQIWLEAGRAYRLVDWSPDAMRSIGDASPADWAKAIGEATFVELPKRLPKIFGP